MLDVTEQLRRYGEAVEHEALGALLVEPDAHPSRRGRGLWVAIAACLVVILSVGVVVWASRRRDEAVNPAVKRRMVFSAPTNTVLLFSDGIDGVLAVDLDRRVAARRAVVGERAGDQPFRLTLTGDSLVVGWGEIYAAPLTGGPSRLIDTATYYVPAAEAGSVWTFDYPGGRIGDGVPTIRRVDTAGNVLFESQGFDTTLNQPLVGVPGGLIVSNTSGLGFWDATNPGIITVIPPRERTYKATSNGGQFAACTDSCGWVYFGDLLTQGNAAPQHVEAGAPVYSPDGTRLAYIDSALTAQLIVRDATDPSKLPTVVAQVETGGALQWSADGTQLFYATNSYQKDTMTLGRYDVRTGEWETRRLPVGGGMGFVALDRAEAGTFLPQKLTKPSRCLPPEAYPSNRSEACGFKL